jgi:plastocyanin
MNKTIDPWMLKTVLAILAVFMVWPVGLLAEETPVLIVERDTSYNPDVIMINLGQVMEVRNRDEFWHSSLISKVDENGFEIKKVFKKRRDVRGGQWEYTFEEPGIYVIRCTNHDGMTADIQVTG